MRVLAALAALLLGLVEPPAEPAEAKPPGEAS
jgi:hypothetical protein